MFAELPRLLERAGPGPETVDGHGFISAVFTVLVEGDDQTEPVADAVRGILDGHIVLDRKIAEQGRYPAVDVLRSLSRSAPGCNTLEQRAIIKKARKAIASYSELSEMIRLGAYRPGSDPDVDDDVRRGPLIEALLGQDSHDQFSMNDSFEALAKVFADG